MKKIACVMMLVFLSACAQAASTSGNCVTSGCSGQLCVKKGEADVSTCEWSAEYACYKQFGTCEEQPNGSCGWSKTYDLTQCLKDPENYAERSLRPDIRDMNGADRRNPWQQ